MSGNTLMSAEVKTVPKFEAAVPKPLFETRMYAANAVNVFRYSPSADGKRFIMNTVSQDAVSAPITVVLNWNSGLKH